MITVSRSTDYYTALRGSNKTPQVENEKVKNCRTKNSCADFVLKELFLVMVVSEESSHASLPPNICPAHEVLVSGRIVETVLVLWSYCGKRFEQTEPRSAN